MAIVQFHKNLLSCNTCCSHIRASSSCLSRFTFMAKLQLPSSPLQELSTPWIGFANKGGKFTHIRFRKSRITRNPSDGHVKVAQFYPQLRCYGDAFGPSSVSTQITFLNFSRIRCTNPMMSVSYSAALSKNYCSQPAEDDVRNRLRVKPFHKSFRKSATPFAAASNQSDTNFEETINGTPVEGLLGSLPNTLKIKVKKTTKKGTDESKVKAKPKSVDRKSVAGARKKKDSIIEDNVNGVALNGLTSTSANRSKENETDESKVKAKPKSVDRKSVAGARKKKDIIIEDNVNGVALNGLTSTSANRSKEKEDKSMKLENTEDEVSKSVTVKKDSTERQLEQKYYSVGRSILNGQPNIKLYPPSGKSVVVVESLTKAKVIQKYLGDMYEVLPSYGHVRDLAARSGSVRPDDDFSMLWEVPSAAWTHLKSIKVALNGATNLILASDPDREGEAIAWHIIEMLQQQHALHDGILVARVVFQEITEAAIKKSLEVPRDIDLNLVNAYLGRRALDYLIGFNISPLLWRKLPGCPSAGRVQSAALSLICDREMEIDQFKPQEYWSVDAIFCNSNSKSSKRGIHFQSHLTQFDSQRLSQLSVSCEKEAKDIEQKLKTSTFKVSSSKKGQNRKNPPAPFITSTLQQESANRLHYPATYTMKLAQKLYEGIQLADGSSTGLITYTRTDGFHISDEAVMDIHALIIKRYGPGFALEGSRKYFKRVKNAQEAHEAIRPTDIKRLPSSLKGTLDEDALRLYTLIWSRTLACQMHPTIMDQIQVDIASFDGHSIFRASSSKINFTGFQEVYQDVETAAVRVRENEEIDKDASFSALNQLKEGDYVHISEVKLEQHHTVPPPRYNEGSLVKKLEELGIGRPSTYASTIKVLQDRNYIAVKSRVLYPEFRGRMVSTFLSNHFSEVADYSFTADMETELDNVSAGMTDWKGLLKDYWTRFSKYCNLASNVTIHQVEKMLEDKFGDYLFASLPNQNRSCPSCLDGTLVFKVSKFGAGYFIGCNQHPRCKYIARTLYGDDDSEISEVDPQKQTTVEEPKLIGVHPSSGEKVLLKIGPYGHYIQLGEDKKGHSPQRASVGHIKDVASVTLEKALDLLSYPKTLGLHPDDRRPVIIKIARAGLAVKHGKTMAPVPKGLDPSDVTLEKAMKILLGPDARHAGRPKSKLKSEF